MKSIFRILASLVVVVILVYLSIPGSLGLYAIEDFFRQLGKSSTLQSLMRVQTFSHLSFQEFTCANRAVSLQLGVTALML